MPELLSRTEHEDLMALGALMNEAELVALASFAAEVPREQAIVELGSWAGGSAAWLGAGSRHGNGAHITCVDIWADWINPPPEQDPVLGVDALARFTETVDWSRTSALKAASLQVAPMWVQPIGLLFIDASHTYKDCRADYEAWFPHIVQGGVLAVHDYVDPPSPELWWAEGPTRAVDEVIAPSGLWESQQVITHMWVGRRC